MFDWRKTVFLIPMVLIGLLGVGCAQPRSGSETAPPQAAAGGEPSATQSPAPGAAANTGPVTATFTAVTEESEAAYHVREQFFGQDALATAIGRTSAVSGEVIIADGVLQPSTVKVDLKTLKSDESRRDNRVRDALGVADHPIATFAIKEVAGNPILPTGTPANVDLIGDLTIKGTTKPVTFAGTIELGNGMVTLVAETTFDMTNFGVTPPSMTRLVTVNEDARITVKFIGRS